MTTTETPDQIHWTQRLRKTWISVVFIVLAGLASQAATAAYWINQTLLETDNFMELVTPVISSPEFAAKAGELVATKTVSALGVEEKVENSLDQLNQYLQAIPEAIGVDPNGPIGRRLSELPDLTLLAEPITTRVESRVSELTTDLISSSRFQSHADESIRGAHAVAVAVLTEDESALPPSITVSGDVELNFRPMIADAIVVVAEAGANALGVDTPRIDSGASSEDILAEVFSARGIEVPDDFGRVVVVSEEQLEPYRSALTTLSRLQWALILLTLLLSFAAIWTNPNRLVGTIWLGVGIVAFQLLSWPLTTTINETVINGLESSQRGLASLLLETATSQLLNRTIFVVAVGVIITLYGMVQVGLKGEETESAETPEETMSSQI